MWQCQRSADCCRGVDEVVMTHDERAEIERAMLGAGATPLRFLPHVDSRFVRLQAKPCPLLVDGACSVYAVRPMNCRRYGCLRENVTLEPWVDGTPQPKTREQRRTLVQLQRKAQKWGRSHGWES